MDEISHRVGRTAPLSDSTTSLWRLHLFLALILITATVVLVFVGRPLSAAVVLLIGAGLNGASALKGWAYRREHLATATGLTPGPPSGPKEHSP